MEINESQLKGLCDIAAAIDDENRIDDDVTGGYVEEPYKSIIDRIYAVVNECEGFTCEASAEPSVNYDGVLDAVNCVGCGSELTEHEKKDGGNCCDDCWLRN